MNGKNGKEVVIVLLMALPLVVIGGVQMVRYPVGEPVPTEVYTAPFDPCDPAYKYLAPPPEDWARPFGNNERTMLIHAVSELRVIVAEQGRRLMELDKRVKALEPVTIEYKGPAVFGIGNESKPVDPNEVKE